MSCPGGTNYNINGSDYTLPTLMSADESTACQATKILERLHTDFTENYTTTNVDSNTTKPSYYLRNQPTSNTNSDKINRFYNILTNAPGTTDGSYRTMVSVIMKGAVDTNETTFDQPPQSNTETELSTSLNFNGIHGLNRVVQILEMKISALSASLSSSSSSSSSSASALSSGDAITRFSKRKDIKNTLEEIAYRENQIYREKFLNVILIIVGIFLIGSQLVQKYFSGGSGGGGGGGGGGGLGGLLGYGFGGSGGLFSRFGGLGLGSSGRSHFDIGNLFKNSSYSLKQRE